ncbi:DUF2235 domain-containing protein, partial [Nostoc sp. NIES-2111]
MRNRKIAACAMNSSAPMDDQVAEAAPAEEQRRNIILCCDGTANEFRRDNTNVVRLYQVLERSPSRQVACYHPGVGTMEAVGALTVTARKVTKLLGMAIGYGLESDLRDLYVFLMRHHRPGDRLFMFGFSRGAYTVRALVGLLRYHGLMEPGNEPLVPYAIRSLMAVNREARKSAEARRDAFATAAAFKATFGTRACKPHFGGVWDTVSSVGWISNPLRVPGTANCPDVAIGRHALALDERRAFFRTNLWRPEPNGGGPRDLKQVWFAGVHSDVGGGYFPAEGDLWKFSLGWMLREAEIAGLRVDAERKAALKLGEADPNAPRHESLSGAWRLAEFIPK